MASATKIVSNCLKVTPIKGWSVIPKLARDIFYMHTKFGDYRFSRSGVMIAGVETENVSCDPDHTRFVIQKLGFDTVYLCAKFDDSSFSRSRDMVGAHQFKCFT